MFPLFNIFTDNYDLFFRCILFSFRTQITILASWFYFHQCLENNSKRNK